MCTCKGKDKKPADKQWKEKMQRTYERGIKQISMIKGSRSFDVFLCFLGEKYGEKREKKNAQTAPKMSPLQSKLPGAFYRPWHAF